jgi:hypothetical protein
VRLRILKRLKRNEKHPGTSNSKKLLTYKIREPQPGEVWSVEDMLSDRHRSCQGGRTVCLVSLFSPANLLPLLPIDQTHWKSENSLWNSVLGRKAGHCVDLRVKWDDQRTVRVTNTMASLSGALHLLIFWS